MKKLNINKILLIALSLVFLFQVFSSFVIIPIEPVISFLGQTNNPIELFFTGLKSIISIFVFSIIVEALYSLGFKRESSLISKNRIFVQGIITYTTIWLTFVTYGLLSVFGLLPKIVEGLRLLNIYLFWYLCINALYKASAKNTENIQTQNDHSVFEKKRITWFGHISGLKKAEVFDGERGEVVYKQNISVNLIYGLIFVVLILFFEPVSFFFVGKNLFGILDGSVEVVSLISFVKFILVFLFFAIVLALFYLLGLALSQGVILYKNSIKIPLATISDTPLFTLLLPQASVVLPLEKLVSFELIKTKRRKSSHYRLLRLKFRMVNGDIFIIKPTMFDLDKFEKILSVLIGEEKKIENYE